MASMSQPATIPAQVTSKIRGLRRAIYLWLSVDGLTRVLLALVVVVAVDLAADWFFRMDRPQRGVCLGLMAAVLAVVAVRRLVRPLAQPLSDDVLALQVEAQHKELGQSLISALQFARIEDHLERLGMSRRLVHATIDQGVRTSAGINFSDVLRRDRLWLNLFVSALVVAAFAGGAAAAPDAASVWWDRVLLGDQEWPQDTHLRVVEAQRDGDAWFITLPRGDDLKLGVEVFQGKVPPVVYLDDRSAGRVSSQAMARRDDAAKQSVVEEQDATKPRFELGYKNVLEEFTLRARGGDGYTPWVEVRLVDRPSVAELSLVLTPPAYTGVAPSPLRQGQGPFDVYPGSRLRISGLSTRPLSQARLHIAPRGKASGAAPPTEHAAIDIDRGDPRRFSIQLPPDKVLSASYQFDVTDAQGRGSKRPEQFILKIVPDRAPLVAAKLLGISSLVVAQAKIPIAATMSDDFAVSDARLAFQTTPPDEKPAADNAPAEKPAADKPSADKPSADKPPAEKPPATPPAGVERRGTLPFAELKARYGKPKLEYTYPFELPPLKLAVGTSVEFHVEATDNDAVSSPKTGRSHSFHVRVVTEDELRADLLRREVEQRKQFEDVTSTQDDLVTESRAVQAAVAGRPTMSNDERAGLLKTQKRQYQAIARCAMVANWLDQIVTEAENNRLEGPEGHYRKVVREKVVLGLRMLADKTIPDAAQKLDNARLAPDSDPAARDRRLQDAVAAQQTASKEMHEILRHMFKSEGYQEMINLLHRTLELQGNVNEATRQRLRELLEGRGDKKEAPKKEDPKKPEK